ncbi:hypothetical protein XENORESO_017099 [Xenotaenia resolanae]|uniref:Uncharacterized protein n=1 Tax=Xenotaenia resolanae TaxID=208358 RepID=A0ABV0WU20_9TELE
MGIKRNQQVKYFDSDMKNLLQSDGKITTFELFIVFTSCKEVLLTLHYYSHLPSFVHFKWTRVRFPAWSKQPDEDLLFEDVSVRFQIDSGVIHFWCEHEPTLI